MGEHFPLPALLSHALVAFTIEFDNEYERRMPHWTTKQGRGAGTGPAPWLVSLVMWSNCMAFISEAGVAVRELERLARTKTNLPGMERWGYVVVEPDVADRGPKPPHSAWLVRPTAAGRKAQEVWRPLFGEIEARWQKRFGKDAIEELRTSLWAVAGQLDIGLPDCLPILGFGLFSKGTEYERRAPDEDGSRLALPLPAILSRVLLASALDFENASDLSLAISANVVRVLDEKGVRVRDLPSLTGVSKEAIAVSMSFLTKRGYAVVEAETAGGRAKVGRLTPKGRKAQEAYRRLLDGLEQRWQKRFGRDTVLGLRDSLERLVGEPTAELSPLFRGLEPYPDGWRASVPRPSTLPHYPMVLHRGGFPDGS
jgi:DNA-binding MarR family transcriptional regulator